ncbi:MAG: 4-hydroxy-tetrahydrodipicolinate synthase [Alphaproteobacteria bacterium]|nr:4-hydroxy-tetrahydrodipicolinate synthase [Alphaproteobacteria bacterium]
MTSHPLSAHAGIWLPLVTPFRDGALDDASVTRLADHLAATPIAGFILAATTGEGLVLDDTETARLVAVATEAIAGRKPVLLGLCGSDTRRLARRVAATASLPIDGMLITCPYYSRPSQDGMRQHFAALAQAADRPILVYNIPYRTGVNLANDTLLRLADDHPVIQGVKDCCADAAQSADLLRRRQPGFAVLTGEDALFFGALTQGADGGVLATAQTDPHAFAAVRDAVLAGDLATARLRWDRLVDLVRLLFAEPNPAPLKHVLWRQGLIASPELRLPMTGISAELAVRLDALLPTARAA